MDNFYDDAKNVESYLAMAEGYDGADLVKVLGQHAPQGASVLEIGMGPGKDLALLDAAGFVPTGSDRSQVFLDRYRAQGGRLPTLLLDGVTLKTDKCFDVIYSNKVLQHLTRQDCRSSLKRQAELLNPAGLLLHALWYGEGADRHHGLLFTKYTKDAIVEVLPDVLELVEWARYREIEEGDSLWVLLRKAA